MNKKSLPNIFLAILVVFISSILVISIVNDKKKVSGDVSLYVSDFCPHCEVIKEYIEEKNITKKINIEIKDTGESLQYYNELMLRSVNCGLDMSTVGVPLLYESGTCYMGEDEIIDYFISRT